MTEPDQFHFDFDDPKAAFELQLHEQWARNEAAQAGDWTEEALCIAWVTQSDGRAWRDWWQQLPRYERERHLRNYRYEREWADEAGKPMRHPTHYEVPREVIEQDRAIVAQMVEDIRQAAIEGRPMPYSIEHAQQNPDFDGFALMKFRRRIDQAMREANVIIVSAPVVEEPRKKRQKIAA